MTNNPHARLTKAEKRLTAREHAQQLRDQRDRQRRRTRWIRIVSITAGILLVALITTLFVTTALNGRSTKTASPTSTDSASFVGKAAPDFTLPDTSGQSVSLASFRGDKAVILYFSEGAGCEACLTQMKSIEQKQSDFSDAGFVVLPIVMNTKDQIEADASTYNVSTPFLLDDGTVSKAYDMLGKGMHAGMPGHSFVVIDKTGVVRWSGDYPSMWLDPKELLSTASGAIK